MRMKKIHLLATLFFIIGSVFLFSTFSNEHSSSAGHRPFQDYSYLLDHLFISVKTTDKYHKDRIDLILKTWYTLAPNAIYFFTDSDDISLYKQSPSASTMVPGHIINTNCSSSHNRKALCCKMNVELEYFLKSKKKWFCHVDDDNYLNVPKLLELLSAYDPNEYWYLGKPSINVPLQILDRKTKKRIQFWFATGGAGFCVSRALLVKITPFITGGKFIRLGEKIRLPDDVTLGYLIDYVVRVPLTVVEEFHSHLEPLKFIKSDAIHQQITFSYSSSQNEINTVSVPDGFDEATDPTRMMSLHCFLFPKATLCHKVSSVNKVT